ncbi:TrmH family RNA methyltransferase [Alteromonas halophila]|uniref:23S rRNA methyltransferase n=1 Tax=Alteromonas halophila TaxID=516698 RepID=A0A918MXZ4_9ALTE|nr:RNA methyltransferase [Alteromonas halophila]GGW81723.1 23S rRNA methyltransferase [Alteromonas halophila]
MKLDDVKKLHQKKYRVEFGHYLVEGEHLIIELHKALTHSADAQRITLYITEARQDWAREFASDFDVKMVSDKQMARLSDTKTPQGVVACVPLPTHSTRQTGVAHNARCIYLHEVQDPGNLGTIIRTLAWFGGFQLLLSPNSVDPFNSKVVRASMGAIFHLPIETDCALKTLPQRFDKFAYLDLQGEAITTPAFANYDCYLFGNEARGVPLDKVSASNAQAFTIAGSGTIDSLNLASSVGICAYQLSVR